jgi:hypothetical protein
MTVKISEGGGDSDASHRSRILSRIVCKRLLQELIGESDLEDFGHVP